MTWQNTYPKLIFSDCLLCQTLFSNSLWTRWVTSSQNLLSQDNSIVRQVSGFCHSDQSNREASPCKNLEGFLSLSKRRSLVRLKKTLPANPSSFGVKSNGRLMIAGWGSFIVIYIPDSMGLGKTLQSIGISDKIAWTYPKALACYYKSDWPLLVVTPASVMDQWKEAIRNWCSSAYPKLKIPNISSNFSYASLVCTPSRH